MMTAKERASLNALQTAQGQHQRPVTIDEVADVCVRPWHRRPRPITSALFMLVAQGLVQYNRGGPTWQITEPGQLRLTTVETTHRTRGDD